MQNSSSLTKFGKVLMVLGGLCIVFIFLSVMIAGSWNKAPEIVQLWGSFIRPIGDIPIIGNLSFIVWGIFFVPGYLIMLLGQKSDDK